MDTKTLVKNLGKVMLLESPIFALMIWAIVDKFDFINIFSTCFRP